MDNKTPHSDLDRLIKRHENGFCMTWSEEHWALEHAKIALEHAKIVRARIAELEEALKAEREKVERLRSGTRARRIL